MIPSKGRKQIVVNDIKYFYIIKGFVRAIILNTKTNKLSSWGEEVKPKWGTQVTPSFIEKLIKENNY
jgi:hypothetical protein